MLIGVDTDWYISAPEFKEIYLTSVLKNMDVSVFDAIQMVIDDRFEGGAYVGVLANNGVGLAPFHEFEDDVPADLKDEIAKVKADLVKGEITVAGVLAE
jgi:basic membrane protein A